jgi:branched-chain amino acid transport system permease protein
MTGKLNIVSGSRWLLILGLPLIAVPLLGLPEYVLHVFIIAFLYAYLCSSWAIVSGFARQVSLGHSSFFGIGAYTVLLLYLYRGVNPWLGTGVSVAAGIALALVVGYPSFRFGVRGPYFTFATLALPEVLRQFVISARSVTGGELGISEPYEGSPFVFQFGSRIPYYYLVFAMWILVILSLRRIQYSKFGYRLFALSQDEDAAAATGVDVQTEKLKALILSAALTSLAGAFYTQYQIYIDPSSVFGLSVSFLIATTSLVGGARVWFGPSLGAFLVIPITEYIRTSIGGSYLGTPLLIYGIVIILVARFMPTGLFTFIMRATTETKAE